MQEGTVSTGIQDFGGRKHLRGGLTAYDSVGVPIVAQYSGSTSGATISRMVGIGRNADRLYRHSADAPARDPGLAGRLPRTMLGRRGRANSKDRRGRGSVANMTFLLPRTVPSPGQMLVAIDAGMISVGRRPRPQSRHVIQDEGGPLTPQKSALSFNGSGIRAFNDPTFDRTNVQVVAELRPLRGPSRSELRILRGLKHSIGGPSR